MKNIFVLLVLIFSISCEKPEPQKPVEPTFPNTPTEPTEPVKPVEPTEPTEPVKPVEPLNKNATFHLNYTKDKNWTLCEQRTFIVFDMFDTSKSEFELCSKLGAKMLCYFSSQYEEWRSDAKEFGELGGPLDTWDGERWINPNDAKNLTVMYKRLLIAKEKGCIGIDLDNIDAETFPKSETKFRGYDAYILDIFKRAKELGLLVSQKNYVEKVSYFSQHVDLYQNEQCQQYKECEVYRNLGKPVFNIEYKPEVCKKTDYMFSVIKDMYKMDKNFTICK